MPLLSLSSLQNDLTFLLKLSSCVEFKLSEHSTAVLGIACVKSALQDYPSDKISKDLLQKYDQYLSQLSLVGVIDKVMNEKFSLIKSNSFLLDYRPNYKC